MSRKRNSYPAENRLSESSSEVFNLIQQTEKLFRYIDDVQQIHYECAENIVVEHCRLIQKRGLISVMQNIRALSDSGMIANALNVSALLVSTTAFSQKNSPLLWRGILGLLHSVDQENIRKNRLVKSKTLNCGWLETNELYVRYFLLATSQDTPNAIVSAYLFYIKNRYRQLGEVNESNFDEFFLSQELLVCETYERLFSLSNVQLNNRHIFVMEKISSMVGICFANDCVKPLIKMFRSKISAFEE